MLTDSQAPAIDLVILGFQYVTDAAGLFERHYGHRTLIGVARNRAVDRRLNKIHILSRGKIRMRYDYKWSFSIIESNISK